MKETIKQAFSEYWTYFLEATPLILMAIIVLSAFWLLTYFLTKALTNTLTKRKHEPIMRLFIVNLFK